MVLYATYLYEVAKLLEINRNKIYDLAGSESLIQISSFTVLVGDYLANIIVIYETINYSRPYFLFMASFKGNFER